MSDIILTKKQFEFINYHLTNEEKYGLAEQNWNKFTKKQKKLFFEFFSAVYPKKSKLVKESEWYNTLGDIVGVFDPTGVVDLVNGISYLRQGDNLFGFLSIISAIPYAGDIVAKPIMGALKLGKPSVKALEKVLSLSKAGRSAEAATELNRLTAQGGLTKKFVDMVGKYGGKIRDFLERNKGGVFGGFKRTLIQWIDLFGNAAKSGTKVRGLGQDIVKGVKGIQGGAGAVKLSKSGQVKMLEDLISLAKKEKGIFTGYRTTKGFFSGKTLFRGMPQLIGRNASVRSLMRQTKWWLGFLDWIGVGNFVGPNEMLAKMSESQLVSKMEEYNKTPEAEKNFNSDFGEALNQSEKTTEPTSTPYGQQIPLSSLQSQPKTSQTSNNPIQNMFRNMFFGSMNPIPGM